MRVTRQEPVAVLGIGAMGHGLATSTLRASIPIGPEEARSRVASLPPPAPLRPG
jgi:3-hydroxyacyl-CoA dehydrogenase